MTTANTEISLTTAISGQLGYFKKKKRLNSQEVSKTNIGIYCDFIRNFEINQLGRTESFVLSVKSTSTPSDSSRPSDASSPIVHH